jgi:amidase
MTGLGPMLGMWEQQRGRPITEDEVEPQTYAVLRRAREKTLDFYLSSLARMQLEVRRMAAFFDDHDVLVTPTMMRPPPRLGVLPTDDHDVDRFLSKLFGLAPFAAPFNASGQPAMSLPLHWSAEGLPVGVQFVGRYGEDATLLQLARQLEEAAPWSHRRPDLARQAEDA